MTVTFSSSVSNAMLTWMNDAAVRGVGEISRRLRHSFIAHIPCIAHSIVSVESLKLVPHAGGEHPGAGVLQLLAAAEDWPHRRVSGCRAIDANRASVEGLMPHKQLPRLSLLA
jgi:hypothetical protein